MRDSLIIVSGGMDSVTLLYDKKDEIGLAVTFDYSSKHNAKEIPFAKYHCEKIGIQHLIIPLGFINDYFKSSLLQSGEKSYQQNLTFKNNIANIVEILKEC